MHNGIRCAVSRSGSICIDCGFLGGRQMSLFKEDDSRLCGTQAFNPAYKAALLFRDLTTAAVLFGQFSIQRTRGLLVLATAYLFTAWPSCRTRCRSRVCSHRTASLAPDRIPVDKLERVFT